MFCRQCGCELGEKDRFCFNCGTPVKPVDMGSIKKVPVEAEEEPVQPVVEPEPIAEPEITAEPGPVEEPVVEVETIEVAEPETAAESEPVEEPETVVEPEPIEEPEPIAEPESVAEPEPEPEPAFESFVEIGAEPEMPQRHSVIDDEIATAGIEHEAFDWNVYSFPSDGPRKTEDIEFDWGIAEGEYKRRPVVDDREIAFAPERPASVIEDMPGEEPEITKEELFGGSVVSGITGEGEGLSKQAARIDKFYKEDKRIEEFQKLLDSEYEKFRTGRPLDQDSFVETVESIKERTADSGNKRFAGLFGGAAEDMDKTSVFQRVSGLESAQPAPSEEIETESKAEEQPVQVEEQPEEKPVAEPAVEAEKPAKKKGGLFGFATRRADKNKTLEMEKEEIQNALDSVFQTKTPEETINDIFGGTEEDEAKQAAQEELDRQLEKQDTIPERKIDDKTTEYDPAALKAKIAADAEEKAAEEKRAAEEAEKAAAEEETKIAVEEQAEEAADTVAEETEAAAEETAEAEEKAEEVAEEAKAEEKTAEGKTEEAAAKTKDAAEKGSKGGTVAIVILAIILVILLALLALKFLVPGFSAENTAVPKAVAMDRAEYNGDLNGVIQTQLDKNYGEAIEIIRYDSSWKAKGMDGTEKIEDNVWYKGKDGTVHYVDEAVVGTVIAYESQRQIMDQNGDLKVLDLIKDGTELRAETEAVISSSNYEPMRSLTFGKIRESGDGTFYAWVREEKTKDTEKIITLEDNGTKLIVTAETIL